MSALLFMLLAWTFVAAGFTAVAHAFLHRRRGASPRARVPVLLLRPVDAATPAELENLAAPLPPHVRQVVLSPFRPRLPPHVEWLPSDPLTPNRKVGHLDYALAVLERHGAVVLAIDADVRVDAALVESLAAPLQTGAALTFAAPWPIDVSGLGGRALRGLLVHSHQNAAALDALRLGAAPVVGKALGLGAAAREVLPSLGHCLGEDLELGARLHARGERVVMTITPAHTPSAAQQGLDPVVERLTRWMQVLRAHRPGLSLTVPLLIAPTPVLLVAWLVTTPPSAWGLLAALLVLRASLAWRLAPRLGGTGEWLLGEATLAWAWWRSLPRTEVVWRGRRLRVRRGGHVDAISAPAT